jgi:type I restriction enzyme, R subunit
MDKRVLSERDIVTKFILPALRKSGWTDAQYREEVSFTDGRIFVKGRQTARGERKRADIILYCKPSIPIAVLEAKDNTHVPGAGLQQALGYAETLDIPVAVSSNGDSFVIQYRKNCGPTNTTARPVITETRTLDSFLTYDEVWKCYCHYNVIDTPEQERISVQDYFYDSSGMKPLYYQSIAVNRTVEAIARGKNRILLVMATGTGKTYTAFQIVYRLWKSGLKKRILYLADRDNLIDQTKRGDFKHFKDKMTIVRHRKVDKAYEVYLALYQGLTNYDEETDTYRQFSSGFFDLVIVDECHRGSAADDSAWRKILEYFSSATQIGMTATPKETDTVSSSDYFGDPIYMYSLKQGIDDGFLAPYKVLRIGIDVDLEGWRPDEGTVDMQGNAVKDRIYNTKDYDRNLVLVKRTETVAKKVIEYLCKTNPLDKTIVFCVDIEHAERMRQTLWNLAPSDWAEQSDKYIMRITGDDKDGKAELDNFIDPEQKYPVITTTSKLMTTGIDAKTCKLIVLDANIGSLTEFKQIIGRGTRIKEDYGKLFFTIMDFRNVTDKFADPDFDGEAVRIKNVSPDDELTEEDISGADEEAQIDPVTGDEVAFPEDVYPFPEDEGPRYVEEPEPGYKGKVYVAGVDVSILNERMQYLGADGKLITESLQDYTKRGLKDRFRTLNNFLTQWNQAEKKKAIIEELEKQGIVLENLQEAAKKDLDVFDLICHIAWGTPALTRRERAEHVKKRNYFTKYGEKARNVLEMLLEKYANEGISNIEETAILRVEPLSSFGTPAEIISLFGGRQQYKKAVRELEREIYKEDAA